MALIPIPILILSANTVTDTEFWSHTSWNRVIAPPVSYGPDYYSKSWRRRRRRQGTHQGSFFAFQFKRPRNVISILRAATNIHRSLRPKKNINSKVVFHFIFQGKINLFRLLRRAHHIFLRITNLRIPELSTYLLLVFILKKISIICILHILILKQESVLRRSKQTAKCCSRFVFSGFVKTCDEYIIIL